MSASPEPQLLPLTWSATQGPAAAPPEPRRWRWAHSLAVEIALAFGVVIALMLVLGAAFYLSEQRSTTTFDKLLKIDGRMADLSLRSGLAMLKARGSESDFLLSLHRLGAAEARERHVAPMQSHLLDMREYLTSIRVISAEAGFVRKLDQIEHEARRYEDGFLAFVALCDKPDQADEASATQQAYVAAAQAIEPLLEDLHTTASKHALQTLAGVEQATRITRWAVYGTLAVATLLGAIVALIVSRRITGSVMQLITFSRRVAAGDFSARAKPGSEHEFAILAQAMNRMAESLENSQTQLLAAARQAGMAEIATNVLHNVGNVLNSVNVSAGLLGTRLRTSKIKGLARAVQLIDEHADDLGAFLSRDPKGRLLPTYLRELAQTLEGEHATMAEELGALAKSVDHIKEVVATQQSYAGAQPVVEFLQLAELVDDALRMNAGALTRHKVEVVKRIAEMPALPLDRHRLLQILVNLIGNAKHAMDGRPDEARPCITLSAGLADERRLRITIADNGEGIAAENLTRIFSHGFTTRKNGHGFGLHSCVMAAQEMGGSLHAHSDGPGHGAVFTLEIPVDAAARTVQPPARDAAQVVAAVA